MARRLRTSDFQGCDTETCIMCGEGQATRSVVTQEFEYGSGPGVVTLYARVPVWSCATCELQYVDAEGERAQHDAVCRHVGRLTPTEIKAVRCGAAMTQKEFALAINVGVASLKRWESGAIIQNKSADAAIRGFQLSRRRASSANPIFRTSFSDAQHAAAAAFKLRWIPQGSELAA